jgi:hypothetical protein
MESCPKCQSKRVHVSRTRSRLERFRRTITGKSPFRCSECGWRGWAFDFSSTHGKTEGVEVPPGEPNLTALDAAIEKSAASDQVDLDRALSPAPRPLAWPDRPSASQEWPPQSAATPAAAARAPATKERAATEPASRPSAGADAALATPPKARLKKRVTKKAPAAAEMAPADASLADSQATQAPTATAGPEDGSAPAPKAPRSRRRTTTTPAFQTAPQPPADPGLQDTPATREASAPHADAPAPDAKAVQIGRGALSADEKHGPLT